MIEGSCGVTVLLPPLSSPPQGAGPATFPRPQPVSRAPAAGRNLTLPCPDLPARPARLGPGLAVPSSPDAGSLRPRPSPGPRPPVPTRPDRCAAGWAAPLIGCRRRPWWLGNPRPGNPRAGPGLGLLPPPAGDSEPGRAPLTLPSTRASPHHGRPQA